MMVILIELIFILFSFISNSLDLTKLEVEYFKEKSNLYYVNVFNDDNGNLYFEFWGESDNYRYFIGKNYTTEEYILFNENEILSIDSNIRSTYHESIVIKNNEDINFFSLNCKYINFLNVEEEYISSRAIIDIFSDLNENGDFSHRNSVIKLSNNNYLMSMVFKTYSCTAFIYCQHVKILVFNFVGNDINNFNIISNYDRNIYFSNSTECFETKNQFIECFFPHRFPSNEFTMYIFDQNLNELATEIYFGYYADSTFTKIFHLKDEIGIYIFFDDRDGKVPKLFIKELIDNNLYDVFNYIVLNTDGLYILDSCLFCSDGIKINESKFLITLTIKNSYDLLICIFDLYNNDSSLRLRYYLLQLSSIDINIKVSLRNFVFRGNFGLAFYDSSSHYPGFIFFNYATITNTNKKDLNTIEIKLFETSSESYTFSIEESFNIINNIYGGIEKIKIVNYISHVQTGVIIKSSKLSLEIETNQIIDLDDTLIFEQSSDGAFPGNHILELAPITYISESDSNTILTKYYGNAQESDFDEVQYFLEKSFKLIYKVECYEKCKSCTQLGSESFYYCVICSNEVLDAENNGEKCVCNKYKYVNSLDENICF